MSRPELPAIASQGALLASMITPKAMKLAADRLRMTDEKLALLLVKIINPLERLTNEEEAVLRGVSRVTIGKMKSRGEIPYVP